MRKQRLNTKLKANHQSDEGAATSNHAEKPVNRRYKNERIKKQFAEQELIYQRMKNPVTAMACCLIQQV